MNEYWLRRIDVQLDEWKAERAEFRAKLESFGVQPAEDFRSQREDIRAQQDDCREFLRDIVVSSEYGWREQVPAMNALSDRIARRSDELVSEMRAERGVLLAAVDRLKPGDSGATA